MKYLLLFLVALNAQAKDCNEYLQEALTRYSATEAMRGWNEGMRNMKECQEGKNREVIRERVIVIEKKQKATYTTCYYNGPVLQCYTQ